jgi:hypothetical protein
MMRIRHASRPTCRIARLQDMSTIILGDGHFTNKCVQELVFMFMPMSLGRPGTWLQRLNADAELSQATSIGVAYCFDEPERFAVLTFCYGLRSSDDHMRSRSIPRN